MPLVVRPQHPREGGSGTSGMSGFSGWSGLPGSFAASGISGTSGFSGYGASAYQWTNRAYVSLDDYKTWVWDGTYPLPDPVVPETNELVLSLEGGQTYFISGAITVGYRNDGVFGAGPMNTATKWKFTGTVGNFLVTFSSGGDPISSYNQVNAWDEVNTTYQGITTSWLLSIGGDKGGVVTGYRPVTISISGSIEVTTAGLLTFCICPYDNSYGAGTHDAVVYRGSYLEALSLGGAASGTSGFSGQDRIVNVGTFTGI